MKTRRKKKRWSDLSPGQQRMTVGAGLVELGLKIAVYADLRRRPAEQIRGSKLLWVALSFVNFVGPVAYFAVGRKR
jgi:phospholipase D-like protein